MIYTGWKSPGTMADDTTVGTYAWSNPNNAKISDDVYTQTFVSINNDNIVDYKVQIIKPDGSIGASNKADTSTVWPNNDTYVSYGAPGDLWGETWAPSDINDSDFGVVLSARVSPSGIISHYLKATNFGFAIPDIATISGILVEVEKREKYLNLGPMAGSGYIPYVDHIRIAVYYTMPKIKFCDAALTELATLNVALSAARTEKLNSENTLNFSCRVKDSAAAYLNENTVCSISGDYYDVAFFKSAQQGDGLLLYDVQCEHVSYRLNDPDYNVDYFTMTGTPTAILAAILDDTGFTVGTVQYTNAITISLLEATSRRGLLMYLVSYLGGDLYCHGFAISILTHRGSAIAKPLTVGKDVTVVSKSINKRERDIDGNPIISYACDVHKGAALALGDVVSLDYEVLGIDVSLRIVGISYDPYNPANVSIEVGNLSARLEDDIYRIETETVAKDKVYHGTRIGPTYGFESIRSDKKARSIVNSDTLAWQIGDGSGANWEDMLYYDSATNKIKFTGDINMLGGSITWGAGGVAHDSTIATAQAAAEAAASAASAAALAASTAQSTANTAVTNAETANGLLSDIANDNKFTASEKQLTKTEWDAIVSEKTKNDTQADAFAVSKTAYGSAYTALSDYITSLLSNLTATSDIVGTTFRANFKAYYDARTDLLNAIAAKAKSLANTAQSAANAAQSTADSAASAASAAQTAIAALKTNLGYTYIDEQYVISPHIVGGDITSNTTINVGTDIYVGKNMYLGVNNDIDAKSIVFSSGASIFNFNGGGIGGMKGITISAIDVLLSGVRNFGTSAGAGDARTELYGYWDFSRANIIGISAQWG